MDDDRLARALARDYRDAALEPADRAMLDYAVKLTREPAAVGAEDAATLREHGFDDAAILDICQVTSYYNYVNRMADGLGVGLESYWGDEEELVLDREELEER